MRLTVGVPGSESSMFQVKLFFRLYRPSCLARTRKTCRPERKPRYEMGARQRFHARPSSEHENVVPGCQRVAPRGRHANVALGETKGRVGIVLRIGRGTTGSGDESVRRGRTRHSYAAVPPVWPSADRARTWKVWLPRASRR